MPQNDDVRGHALTQVRVASLPAGVPGETTWQYIHDPTLEPANGEVTPRLEILSVDPPTTGWITFGLTGCKPSPHCTAACCGRSIPHSHRSGSRWGLDNVGGEVLDATLMLLNRHARIVLCGAVSQHGNASGADASPLELSPDHDAERAAFGSRCATTCTAFQSPFRTCRFGWMKGS